MGEVKRRLLAGRLLEAMKRDPDYARTLTLRDVSIRAKSKGEKGDDHGKKTQI